MSECKFSCKVVKELDYSSVSIILLENGRVYAERKSELKGHKYAVSVLLDISDIIDIIATRYCIFFLRKDGNVYSLWTGYPPVLTNDKYVLNNMNIYVVKKIAHCDPESIVFLKDNGVAYGYGDNDKGQLGIDISIRYVDILTELMSNVKDVACGSGHTVFLLNDGTVYHCGYYGHKSLKICDIAIKALSQVKLPDKVKSISCNKCSSIFELENGDKYGYGRPSDLGLETENNFCTEEPILLK